MQFSIKARTVLQLGAELISSDAVAFYELIKNAFDAGGKSATIELVQRVPHPLRDTLVRRLDEPMTAADITEARTRLWEAIDVTAPSATELQEAAKAVRTKEALRHLLDDCNYIRVSDLGSGMSKTTLSSVFLTIGTPHRQIERRDSGRRLLGEKGLGRLSAMRLGDVLRVSTSLSGERTQHELTIDWRAFGEDREANLEDIKLPEVRETSKDAKDESGTVLHITALKSDWNYEKLKAVAEEDFSRFTDPFVAKPGFRVHARFNDRAILVRPFERLLFEHAHARLTADYRIEKGSPVLRGHVKYMQRGREVSFVLDRAELASIISPLPADLLVSLGAFHAELNWYNRRILTAVDGIGDRQRVLSLVNQWAGGLMLFRDGFRVHPYGGVEDDWLSLDKKALSSAGYKVNRRQIIGKVDISTRDNPKLVDQTNREGLQDTEEKLAFVALLRSLVEARLRAFLNTVDREVSAQDPIDVAEIRGRVRHERKQIQSSLRTLISKYPRLKRERPLIDGIKSSLQQIAGLMKQAESVATSYEEKRSELIHLAGLGLMVEIVAHELNRATHHALSTLGTMDRRSVPSAVSTSLTSLESQLKTLGKRLRFLDPLATSGRQVKEPFDLAELVREVLSAHEAQFARHAIEMSFVVKPRSAGRLNVRMVRGMIVQVLENLLSNSAYWLKHQRRLEPKHKPRIDIVLDFESRTLSITDNGPGVRTDMREQIFQPFVTSKPPGEGKGLGLYISREIAKYHGASLTMSGSPAIHSNKLNTFVLNLPRE